MISSTIATGVSAPSDFGSGSHSFSSPKALLLTRPSFSWTMIAEPTDGWVISALIASVAASIVIPGGLLLRRRGDVRLPAPPRRMVTGKAGLELKTGPRREQISDTTPSYSNRPKIRTRQPAGLSQTLAQPSTALRDDHSHEAGPETTETPQNLDFNPALYTVKAFGIATFAVTLGAVTLVWGVKNAMGVEDTQEFARRMRQLILTHMPILSSRIHGSLEDDPHNDEKSKSDADGWNWDDAEKRLKNAFEQKGLAGWAEAAVDEIRAEEHAERKKRIALEENMKR